MLLLTGNRTSDSKNIYYSYNQTVNRLITLHSSLTNYSCTSHECIKITLFAVYLINKSNPPA